MKVTLLGDSIRLMGHLTEEEIEICSRQVADAILDVAKSTLTIM